jgi:hypothetical protein
MQCWETRSVGCGDFARAFALPTLRLKRLPSIIVLKAEIKFMLCEEQ